MDFTLLMFRVLASLALMCGIMVILSRNAVHSALFLVGVFISVAGIYVVMGAEFLAVVQVLVYAGGILVLFLFVIMLVRKDQMVSKRRVRLLAAGGTILIILFGLLMAQQLNAAGEGGTTGPDADSTRLGNIERVGMTLFQDYILPFEVASVLLLVAMIGAIVLAREAY